PRRRCTTAARSTAGRGGVGSGLGSKRHPGDLPRHRTSAEFAGLRGIRGAPEPGFEPGITDPKSLLACSPWVATLPLVAILLGFRSPLSVRGRLDSRGLVSRLVSVGPPKRGLLRY